MISKSEKRHLFWDRWSNSLVQFSAHENKIRRRHTQTVLFFNNKVGIILA
jgi:hypothetical protein